MPIGSTVVARYLAAILLTVAAFAAKPPAKSAPKAPAQPKVPAAPLTADQRAAQAIMKSMTLHDKAAQLVIVVSNGDVLSTKSADYEKFRHWVRDLHVGGLIVNNTVQYGVVRNAEPHAMAVFLNQMQRMAKVPLLVASDYERGASFRVSGGTRFPHSMAFGAANDLAASRFEGLITAREARATGIQWIFAPVADVNNNPANPVINLRSYGEDPDQVSKHVAAFIDGAHSDPAAKVLVTAKHFPGHGDTDVDSHLGLPRLEVQRDRLDAIELKPFESAIAHGVDSIMTAHMAVPALDDTGVPATVSRAVLTNVLRDQLHFRNLIVTDAMNMQGLTMLFDSGEGSVRSLIAGADVLLMPSDPDKAVRAVVAAVEAGRISKQRLDQSVLRVVTAKVSLGLVKKKLVDLDTVLPLPSGSRPCLMVVTERRNSPLGQRMMQEFQRRATAGRVLAVETSLPLAALEAALGDPKACSSVVLGSFAGVSADLHDVKPFLEKLAAGPVPMALVAFENPYLLATVPTVPAYLTTFSSAAPSELSAVKALFGEMPINGHTPVTIPGIARLGDGIQLARRP
jgi:beta-N-acetylhexosaminidase